MILIVYTTHYRKGSDMFARIAQTLQEEKMENQSQNIQCLGIHGKKQLISLFNEIRINQQKISEYHFVGHAGMYGPMYGTVNYPEQISPFEWKTLDIPFEENAKAYFHCCRSARWFAPFFAEVFQVETYGYHWYTTFSANKLRYKRVKSNTKLVYAAGCPGRKSHGLLASLKKYSGLMELEKLKLFKPSKNTSDKTYDKVAKLYNAVFQDIKVRKDEWKWLVNHLPKEKNTHVVDLGCGNGALLKELAPSIEKGIGLDISGQILEHAINNHVLNKHISFKQITGPMLPVENNSVDLVISLLSFRYLDWDPVMSEIKRILKPGGKLLIIDMVTVPPKWYEIPAFVKSKFNQYVQRYTHREFYQHLSKLVNHPDWKKMLQYNPIRAEHEMKWYLESRFPGRKVDKINVGWNSCILAFDSGNIDDITDIHLTYP